MVSGMQGVRARSALSGTRFADLHWVAETHGGLGEDGAKEFINQLKKDKRYQRDVY